MARKSNKTAHVLGLITKKKVDSQDNIEEGQLQQNDNQDLDYQSNLQQSTQNLNYQSDFQQPAQNLNYQSDFQQPAQNLNYQSDFQQPAQNLNYQSDFQQSTQNLNYQSDFQQPAQNLNYQSDFQQPAQNLNYQSDFQQPAQNLNYQSDFQQSAQNLNYQSDFQQPAQNLNYQSDFQQPAQNLNYQSDSNFQKSNEKLNNIEIKSSNNDDISNIIKKKLMEEVLNDENIDISDLTDEDNMSLADVMSKIQNENLSKDKQKDNFENDILKQNTNVLNKDIDILDESTEILNGVVTPVISKDGYTEEYNETVTIKNTPVVKTFKPIDFDSGEFVEYIDVEEAIPINDNGEIDEKQSIKDTKNEYCYVNVTEEIVKERVVEIMKKMGVCTCSRCIADTTALSLTNLPPKYVVTDDESILPIKNYFANKHAADILFKITNACKCVGSNPHHK